MDEIDRIAVREAMVRYIPMRDAVILRQLYGFDQPAQTKREVAQIWCISHSRICQIEKRAFRLLRRALR